MSVILTLPGHHYYCVQKERKDGRLERQKEERKTESNKKVKRRTEIMNERNQKESNKRFFHECPWITEFIKNVGEKIRCEAVPSI